MESEGDMGSKVNPILRVLLSRGSRDNVRKSGRLSYLRSEKSDDEFWI